MMATSTSRGSYRQRHNERQKLKIQPIRVIADQKCTKIVQRLPETVLNGFEALWRQNLLCDVNIITEKRDFRAHSLVLATCSDYFYDLFIDQRAIEITEVDLTHIDADTFEVILESMYTGKVQLTEGILFLELFIN